MNLRDLHYLITLAETKHFGQAAQKCFVSQPTLSMQLKKLEEELGVELIERAHKKVLFTQVGQQVIEKAKTILQEVHAIKNIAKLAANPLHVTLHLGLIPTVGPYLLPKILPKIKEVMPQLQLFLHEEKTNDALHLLQEGKLDAVILALPVDVQRVEICELYKEPFLLACPIDHRLAKKKQIHISDLDSENILLLSEGHCLREQALEVCHLKPGINEFAATSLETLRYMVAAGNGVTLLPKLACDFENAMIAVRHFTGSEPTRTIGLIWRKGSSLTSCLEQLAKLFMKK